MPKDFRLVLEAPSFVVDAMGDYRSLPLGLRYVDRGTGARPSRRLEGSGVYV